MPNPISTSATILVGAPLAHVFTTACGFDIPAIIKSHGAIPGVMKVDEHQGAWSEPGQVRLLTLSDGSSVREELTSFALNESYDYRVSSFTGPFAALVTEGHGRWDFTQTGPAATQIDWLYSFTPKSFLAGPAVAFIVKVLWPGYIRAALARLKTEAERTAPTP